YATGSGFEGWAKATRADRLIVQLQKNGGHDAKGAFAQPTLLLVVPANAGTHTALSSPLRQDGRYRQKNTHRRGLWVPAFAGTTQGRGQPRRKPTSSPRAPRARIRRRRNRNSRFWSAVRRRSSASDRKSAGHIAAPFPLHRGWCRN